MAKFIIKEPFWQLFPRAEISIILAKGVDNTASNARPEIAEGLKKANKEAEKFLTEDVFSENAVIKVWRQAYQLFKTKKGARSSMEALLKRVERGNGVGAINPLVDIYNTVSLTFGLPCGGEDIDAFAGDMVLTKADGGEPFMALGDDACDNALPGEICYKDGAGAVCRCWNWRDGQRTMLTERTVNAFLIIESVDPAKHDDLMKAAQTLAELTRRYLGGATETAHMNVNNKEIAL